MERLEYFERAGIIPPRMAEIIRANKEELKDKASSVVDAINNKTNAFIHGPASTYKSAMSCYSIYLFFKKRLPTMQQLKEIWKTSPSYDPIAAIQKAAAFISVPDIVIRTFDEQRHLYSHVVDLQLLVLDDIGVEIENRWTIQILYNIMNARYNKILPTILTSNYSMSELSKRIKSERIMRRIRHRCFVVQTG